ncbi:syntaxin-16 [Eurytemora carolleeae]|uniref:syntaxin-16 n=1 Tax=Eurytemora carolleeae TaxID=1294199 RepID=UPI000C783985|nr:syntaxin-16 [Eurytemora carolleeae]|eukprot:XP_023347674.1 syntaxin-16-like [Eurytemora affinis]
MAPFRSHYDSFLFMRNNSIQRRRFANEQDGLFSDDARVSLLRRDATDPEVPDPVAPAWAGRVEGLNYQISRVEKKVEELDVLHKTHLSRPNLDDEDGEERNIQKLTQEATTMFTGCQRQLKQLQEMSRRAGGKEGIIVRNIVINLVNRLQEITGKFRVSQGDYLRRIKAREERSEQYFSSFQGEDDDGLLMDEPARVPWSKQDFIQFEENNKFLRKREAEITHIVESIQDLNTVFKELAQMVSEQGEIVDRIDYNIESAGFKVEQGLKQLQKAEKYQSKNRKMKCILLLTGVFIFLVLILIISKS